MPSPSTTWSGFPPARRNMVGNQSVIWTSPYETRPKIDSEGVAYLNVIKNQQISLRDCFDFLILLKLL